MKCEVCDKLSTLKERKWDSKRKAFHLLSFLNFILFLSVKLAKRQTCFPVEMGSQEYEQKPVPSFKKINLNLIRQLTQRHSASLFKFGNKTELEKQIQVCGYERERERGI